MPARFKSDVRAPEAALFSGQALRRPRGTDPVSASYLDRDPRAVLGEAPAWAVGRVKSDSGRVFHKYGMRVFHKYEMYEMVDAGAVVRVIGKGKSTPLTPATSTVRAEGSRQFMERVRDIASLPPGWEGNAIAASTVLTALSVQLSTAPVASAPSIAPMVDGSLIMSWLFDDGSSIEIVIEEDEDFPTYAMLARNGVVEELALAGADTLKMLLARQGQYSDPGIRRATYSF